MTILISIIVVITLVHFIYEGIFAPYIRLRLRNRLFEIRDGLRLLIVDGVSKEDELALKFVHDGVNNFIDRLPALTIVNTSRMERSFRDNDELQRSLKKDIDAVMRCRDKRITDAFRDVNNVLERAMIANAGGWMIYLVPAAMLLIAAKQLSKFVSSLVLSPEYQVDKFIPKIHGMNYAKIAP